MCTYDSVNHLESAQALINCFRCVYAVCDGYFIFDLNTRNGLKRWNSIQVDESSEDALIIVRGIYDGQGNKAGTRITGFATVSQGLYERFDEIVYNTVFELEQVNRRCSKSAGEVSTSLAFRNSRLPWPNRKTKGGSS